MVTIRKRVTEAGVIRQKLQPSGAVVAFVNATVAENVSTVGDQIKAAIESSAGIKVTCGTCLAYLQTLNQITTHDHNAMSNKLAAEISWPDRMKHAARVAMVSDLIAPIVPKPPAPAPRPREVGTLQFIIPYFHQEARSDELRWCLRSIHANYLGQAHVTLIGDKPDWFVGHHINKPRLKPQSFRRYRDSLSKIDMIR
jgi:hypothetical protein